MYLTSPDLKGPRKAIIFIQRSSLILSVLLCVHNLYQAQNASDALLYSQRNPLTA